MPQVPPGYGAQPAQPRLSVRRSSQYGKMVQLWSVHGRQILVNVVSVVVNWALPLDDTLMLVSLAPQPIYGKGSVIGVTTSSPWLPLSVEPATMLPLIC